MKFILFFLGLFAVFFILVNNDYFNPPKIYDCFLFYNEFDLLEIRLEELYPLVDHFVLVEAAETFRGQKKPFNFHDQKERFSKFADKIIYIPVTGYFDTENPWKRERFQRNQILQGLKGCKKKDIILISDIDEIPRKDKVKEVYAGLISGKQEAVVFQQQMYFGFLNRFRGFWNGTVATTYGQLKRLTPKYVRKLRHMKPRLLKRSHIHKIELLEKGGWHFSSVGGVDNYLGKIRAFSHAEFDHEEYTRKENLLQVLKSDPLVPIDDTFPQFIQDHKEHFRRIGLVDE